ncbi:MAG: PQQ-dependent sugar dehydrogenase [Pseudomonadales bacterium]|nr:PQQ-dependent sugar dehydrogenase [Pseudomonadales bacterium]
MLLFSVAASFFYLSALGVKFDRSLLKTAMGIPAPKATQRGLADHVSVPLDFGIEVHAGLVPGARMMAVTERGDLIVSSPREGKVFIVYKDDLGEVLVKPLLRSLNYPHGLDIHEGWLYVAESGGVSRIKFDAQRRSVIGEVKPIINGLPEGGNHRTKTIKFGPDGFLYLSVGSSCNVCVEEDKRRATIMRYNADGSGEEVFASGLRNSVGFDWSLQDSRLYATDNGRDLLGDDFPPCELNQIEKGNFYGWPYANGAKILDPDLGEGKDILVQGSIAPVHEFRAHNAPLGMAFIAGKTLPKNYQGAALVALHGSWNRRERDGYKVVSLHWKKDGSIVEKDFVAGFHDGDTILARPVDVVEGHDGTIYISDDYAGAIYKVRYFQP